jgi:hypothetical protein
MSWFSLSSILFSPEIKKRGGFLGSLVRLCVASIQLRPFSHRGVRLTELCNNLTDYNLFNFFESISPLRMLSIKAANSNCCLNRGRIVCAMAGAVYGPVVVL